MTRFDGADISHYQNEAGPIDWPLLRAASLGSYFACKCTQRNNYLDPFFNSNRLNAHTIGFNYILFYHWQSPAGQASIKDQAGFFLSKVGPIQLNEGWMIDAEENGITESDTYELKTRIEDKLQRPGVIYTGYSVAGGSIWNSSRLYQDGTARHLAAYTSEAKVKALPGVDPPPWDLWQFSSNGPVPGIVGRCDMNRLDNPVALDKICGISSYQPVEDDMKLNILLDQSNGSEYVTADFVQYRAVAPDDVNFFKAHGLLNLDSAGNPVILDITLIPGFLSRMESTYPVVPSSGTCKFVNGPTHLDSVPGVLH